ncbi:MAG: chemotaxis protein CheB [Acidobacteriota bacterium]
MKPRKLVVIGTSAGGIEALHAILSRLPATLPAAVLIVLHTSTGAGHVLQKVLGCSSSLPVQYPEDRTEMQQGRVYLAPPDFQMTVEDGQIRVLKEARENRHRPAIDPLFRSAARHYGAQVLGVILTGLLDDGALGLMVVHAHGGKAIIQDPRTAQFPGMPESALKQIPDARVLPLVEIAPTVAALVEGDLSPEPPTADNSKIGEENRRGRPSEFACPDCGGVLWEAEDGGLLHFRCRVGHAFTVRQLDAERRRATDAALWSGLRALEENAALYRRMADRATKGSRDATAEKLNERAASAESSARVLKAFLIRSNQQIPEWAGHQD